MRGPDVLVVVLVVALAAGCVATAPPPPARPAAYDGPDVLDVPRMREPPVLDRAISLGEWDDALLIEGEFVIDDDSLAHGVYPFQMWIGADERNLYLAVLHPNISRNPWSVEGEAWYPDFVDVLLADGLEGGLTVPSDMKSFSNNWDQGSRTDDGYWNGEAWVLQPGGSLGGHDFNGGRPTGGTWGRGGYTNDSILTEAYIPRTPERPQYDGVHIQEGSAFRMCLLFTRQGDPEKGPDGSGHTLEYHPHDAYPGDGYTPDGHYDPTTWLKLRVGF